MNLKPPRFKLIASDFYVLSMVFLLCQMGCPIRDEIGYRFYVLFGIASVVSLGTFMIKRGMDDVY